MLFASFDGPLSSLDSGKLCHRFTRKTWLSLALGAWFPAAQSARQSLHRRASRRRRWGIVRRRICRLRLCVVLTCWSSRVRQTFILKWMREREREPTSIRLITPPWGIESSVHGAARKGRVEEGGDIWKEHRIETALMVSDDDRLSSEMNCYNILICLVWRSSVSDWPLAPGGYRLVATVTNPVPLIMVSLCGSRRGRCGNVTRIASSRIFVSRIPYLSCGRSWDVCGTSPRFSFLFLFSTAFRFEPTWTIFVVVRRFATTGWRREPMNTSSSWTCAALSWRLFVSERKKCLVDAALLSRSPTWWNAFLWCLPIKNYEPMIGVDMNQRKASS